MSLCQDKEGNNGSGKGFPGGILTTSLSLLRDGVILQGILANNGWIMVALLSKTINYTVDLQPFKDHTLYIFSSQVGLTPEKYIRTQISTAEEIPPHINHNLC